MASLGGAGESAAAAAGAGERGSATATLLAGAGLTVVAVDRTPKALDELPEGIRREVAKRPIRLWPRPSSTRLRTASVRRPSATSSGSSTLSCARRVSG